MSHFLIKLYQFVAIPDYIFVACCYSSTTVFNNYQAFSQFVLLMFAFPVFSMKKGKIVGVSKVIPSDSPFKTYRDLKRHWKNTVSTVE